MVLVILAVSVGISLLIVPAIRWVSLRLGKIEQPREDRWHERPIPTLGGAGIFIAFLLIVVVYQFLYVDQVNMPWGVILGTGLIFGIGLIDDFRPLTPPTKLLGQIFASTSVVFLGYTTNFFTPRISNDLIAQIPNILLTYFWLIGITNAVNLLDNMDGLAGGIAAITSAILAYLFWRSGNTSFMILALAICGSTLGFLVFNFPPATIFMGDGGSQFLGFSLALLAIARQPQASNVFAVLGVPTLLFVLPILDTIFVAITRLLQGQSPVQGGRDHTSHRLVAFGLSERQTLVVLYAVAIVSGVVGILIETLDYWLSLVMVPLLVISLALFAAYLSRFRVVAKTNMIRSRTLNRWLIDLTYRRRIFEIVLDFFIIGTAYYLAFWVNYGLSMSIPQMENYLRSLPLVFACAYISFYVFGVYRGVWKYIGIDDLLRFAKATMVGITLLYVIDQLTGNFGNIETEIYLLFFVFLFLGLATTRSSFKIFDQISSQQTRFVKERVIILGGGDAGEMALRWILMNPEFRFKPVGILDTNSMNAGRQIHGIRILGGTDSLETILKKNNIHGVVLTSEYAKSGVDNEWIINLCQSLNCWVRILRLEFELIEGKYDSNG